MKSLATLVVLGLLAGSASAADVQISQGTLASIGLPGFAKMSQADAMNVRGKSYVVIAAGGSFAVAPASASANGYLAAASGNGSGSHGASGYNVSLAVSGIGGNGGFLVIGALAGGASGASVH